MKNSGEFERISRWLLPLAEADSALQDLQSSVLIANGDDALAIHAPAPLVMSIDVAVADTHFPHNADPADIASKALRAALSDLGAMGARPWFYTLGLVMPRDLSDTWLQGFATSLRAENRQWHCQCLGGDLTRGIQLSIAVQVHGLCEYPLARHGAKIGDQLWVTGTLGGAAAGLPMALGEQPADSRLLDAFYRPSLPLEFMSALGGKAAAAIDVSDGLVADLNHLLSASRVGATIALDDLPLHPALCDHPDQGLIAALYGGEDYQVLFTAHPDQAETVLRLAGKHHQPVTCIGTIEQAPGLRASLDGQPYDLRERNTGFDHFD